MIWEAFLPALSAAFVVVGGILGGIVKVGKWFAETKAEGEAFRKDLAEVKTDLREIKPKVDTILQVQVQQMNDGKRLDRLETRVDAMEVKRA